MKIIIFGNSGSGKSTLAKQLLDEQHQLSHLDLDTLAWEATQPPTRKPLNKSKVQIEQFIKAHENWVIEGCYADLIELLIVEASHVYFINPTIQTCIDNCKNRPWEPHKYSSIEEQDKNLDMLIDWIKEYPKRTDEFSLQAHRQLFDSFQGSKTEYNSNSRDKK